MIALAAVIIQDLDGTTDIAGYDTLEVSLAPKDPRAGAAIVHLLDTNKSAKPKQTPESLRAPYKWPKTIRLRRSGC